MNQLMHRTAPVLLYVIVMSLVLFPLPVQAQTANVCTATATVEPGDTLISLAANYLGDPLAYEAIIEATNQAAAADSTYTSISDPNQIGVGWIFCIPGSTTADEGEAVAPPAPSQSSPEPTPVPASPPTPVPVPTPPALDLALDEMHPLMVEYMREQEYPGSDVVIEEVLEPGSNYDRYIASYQSEGLKIYALLTVPQGQRPETGWPVIIFNHGYIPPEVYRTTERYVAYVDAFARSGYIVFRPDYRGHGFSEGEPTSSRGSPDYTIDVLNAVSSMKRYVDADPERIGMWGHSMGGLLTLRSMVTTQDVKAGVIWAGVVGTYEELYERRRWASNSDSASQTNNPAWNNRRRWREEIVEQWGTPEENPAIWAAISPNSYVGELSGPMQLHHGTADSDVPVEWSRLLDEQIQAVGGVVEYYEYPGDNHNISANLGTALARSVAFFDTYLK
jgi:dienelactone hydrolase